MYPEAQKKDVSMTYLQHAYPYTPQDHSFTIRLALKDYTALFNALDPTPFCIRDLSTETIDFLLSCSGDIPPEFALKLQINIGEEQQKDDKLEQEIRLGFKHYFEYIVNNEREKIRRSRSRMGKYVVMSFVFITCSALLSGLAGENFMLNFLREGCMIGGWVFLWQAFDMNFIQMDEIKDTLKINRRLAGAEIAFCYPPAEPTIKTNP